MASIFKRKYYIIWCLLSFPFAVLAQTDSAKLHSSLFSEKGFIVGYGHGLSRNDIPEGNYRPIIVAAHCAINPFKKAGKKLPGLINIFFEPQVNPVLILNSPQDNWNLEFGLNVGIQHNYPLYRNLYVYELISSGPHFIGVHTVNQSRGFIFSDNMGAGLYLFVTKNLALNFGFRIRHLSNANTEMPNHGINTYNFLGGVSRVIW